MQRVRLYTQQTSLTGIFLFTFYRPTFSAECNALKNVWLNPVFKNPNPYCDGHLMTTFFVVSPWDKYKQKITLLIAGIAESIQSFWKLSYREQIIGNKLNSSMHYRYVKNLINDLAM
jgi:hypothetical protein